MDNKKLPDDFNYLPDMYNDQYFPNFLVDKVKEAIIEAVVFIEKGGHTTAQIQDAFDQMTLKINGLEDEFEENDSEIETGARESIGETVERIIQYFELDIDTEDAIKEREW
jgi:hypothetical protein